MDDPIAQAAAAHAADVQSLGDLDDGQVKYLAGLQHVPDPDSDGMECDHLESDETSAEEVTDGGT